MNGPDETQLARRCEPGDPEAFRLAVEQHLPALLRFARAQCDGELAANAVLVRAVEAAARDLPGCARAENVLAWLLQAIHRSCSSLARSQP